jgi:hypothetical protein
LIPVGGVSIAVQTHGIGLRTVKQLGRTYAVSASAVYRRLADLTNTTLIRVTVIPYRCKRLDSFAVVDEAMYVVPNVGLVFDSTAVLASKIAFSELVARANVRTAVNGSEGRVIADFEVSSRRDPIPNADLFASSVSFRPKYWNFLN